MPTDQSGVVHLRCETALCARVAFRSLLRCIFSPSKRDELFGDKLSLDFLYKAPNTREFIPRSGLRVEAWFAMSGVNSTCHFKLSLVTFSSTPFSVIFIFSSGAQCIYQHSTAQAPTPSQALIHKNLFIVCACAPVWDGGSRGCVRTRGEAGLGESLLTFPEPIGRLVRFSRRPMRRLERLEVGVA